MRDVMLEYWLPGLSVDGLGFAAAYGRASSIETGPDGPFVSRVQFRNAAVRNGRVERRYVFDTEDPDGNIISRGVPVVVDPGMIAVFNTAGAQTAGQPATDPTAGPFESARLNGLLGEFEWRKAWALRGDPKPELFEAAAEARGRLEIALVDSGNLAERDRWVEWQA